MPFKMNFLTDVNKSLKNELFRKAIHLSSLWMPLFIYLTDKITALGVFAFLLAADFLVEYFSYIAAVSRLSILMIIRFCIRILYCQK